MKHNQIAQSVSKHIKQIELEMNLQRIIGGLTKKEFMSLMKKPKPEDFCKIREPNR